MSFFGLGHAWRNTSAAFSSSTVADNLRRIFAPLEPASNRTGAFLMRRRQGIAALRLRSLSSVLTYLTTTITRRYRRMRRRRTVGRAYDMALEISQFLKSGITILDVGCGNGFIAHHLTGMLNAEVVGLDVAPDTSARIKFLRFDGRKFPVSNQSFDAVLLCYVLHHARDAHVLLTEVRRVLRDQGRVIIYEDNPAGWWNRAVCWTHNLQWRSRTGACTFQLANDWLRIFQNAGFKVTKQRVLSRWRNLAHPVARNFFILEAQANAIALQADPMTTILTNEIAA